jgi:hypothetical protein
MVRHQVDSATTMEHVIPRNPHQQRNSVFCWVRAEAISGESKHKPVSPNWSLERVCRQTDQSESEAVARQLPLVEAWEAEEASLL